MVLVTKEPRFLLFALLSPLMALGTYISDKQRPQRTIEPPSRLDRLARALAEVSTLTAELEHEVTERSKVVEKLRADAERYTAIAALKWEEVEAVAQSLQRELGKSEAKGYLVNAVVNVIVAAAAFGLGLIIR